MARLTSFLYLFSFLHLNVACEAIEDVVYGVSSENIPMLLWWTPFSGIYEKTRLCSKGKCIFSEDRSKLNDSRTYGLLFYGSDFEISDLPLPRNEKHWWNLLHEESPKNRPLFNHLDAISLFNLTSTFSQFSDMPLTLQYLKSIEDLTSLEYFESTSSKNKYLEDLNLAPIIYLQSDCNPPSERDDFVKELQKYIKVDSYGQCLNNRKLPDHLVGIEAINHSELKKIIAKYKFVLSLENYACDDYITEKLWRPLSVGTVPIYWGAPTINQWIPNNDSIINIRDFNSTEMLARYLHTLLRNDHHYELHLRHKIQKIIENPKLLFTIGERKWGIEEDQLTKGTFVEYYECFVCDKILEHGNNGRIKMANQKHYGCSPPETVLDNAVNKKSSWTSEWYTSKVEARIFSEMVKSRKEFTMNQFHTKLLDALQNEDHIFLREDL